MNMRILGFLFLLSITCNCKIEQEATTANLVAFAKVYGYVKYFHPSDEAASIDWDLFASYGAERIQHCSNDNELVEVLYELFKPIAPSIKFNFSDEVEVMANNAYQLFPLDASTPTKVFWQHEGLGLGTSGPDGFYTSRKVVVKDGVIKDKLFSLIPEMDAKISSEIKNNVSVVLPIVLDKDFMGTYPRTNHQALKRLKDNLQNYSIDFQKAPARFGNVIIIYNVFEHFYPYHEVVSYDWKEELEKALKQSIIDRNEEDHLTTIEQMMASLRDGHLHVSKYSDKKRYFPPLYWEWIEGKLIITKVVADGDTFTNLLANTNNIKVGDEVTHINGTAAKAYFKKIESRISAGTNSSLKYKAQSKRLLGPKGTTINLTIDSTEISLTRTLDILKEHPRPLVNEHTHKQIEEGIAYLNLNNISMKEIERLLPQLVKSEAIICDLRGYPNGNHEFIKHLMVTNDTSTNWMQTPQIVYPNHREPYNFKLANWTDEMKPTTPYLGDKKIIFITDGRAISYAESYLSYIEGYNLATIVGETTAGTNGVYNRFSLLGDYNVTWTGMKVIKHDGSQLHGIGIEPDVIVKKSIAGVKKGIDEQLEVAIQLAKGKD